MASPDVPITVHHRPGFVLGLLVGLVVGFGAGVLADKGCPPVPVPGATGAPAAESSAPQPAAAPAPALETKP